MLGKSPAPPRMLRVLDGKVDLKPDQDFMLMPEIIPKFLEAFQKLNDLHLAIRCRVFTVSSETLKT